jgi:hypothetical protein
MRRPAFIEGIASSAAAWPLVVRAQQPAIPVIGFLNGASPQPFEYYVAGFCAALIEAEPRNEYGIAEMDFPLISHEAGMDSRS